MGFFLTSALLFTQTDPTNIDLGQLFRVIKGAHDEINDLSLVFEGKNEFVGPPDLLNLPVDRWTTTFQGNLLYRKDGAAMMSEYLKRNRTEPKVTHMVTSLFKGKREEVELYPDDRYSQPLVSGTGGQSALNRPFSPYRILLMWYFESLSSDQAAGFEMLGWEEVSGVRCLKLRDRRGAETSGRVQTFWIDIERGGHPLKLEWHDGPNLALRTHDIRLEQFNLPGGKKTWLPVRGITDTFRLKGIYHQEPIIRELYSIPMSSVRINQGLSDRYFTAKSGGLIPGDSAPNPLRRQFDFEAAQPPQPPLRTDRASVQKRLDEQLEQADRQAKMIEASSSSRQRWNINAMIQIVSIVVGSTLIIGVIYLKLRKA